MRKTITAASIVSLGAMSFTALAVNQAIHSKGAINTPQGKFERTIIRTDKVGISKSIRDIATPLPKITKQRKQKLAASGQDIPGIDQVKLIKNHFPFESKWANAAKVKDPALQNYVEKRPYAAMSAPVTGVSFDGVGNALGVAPPDTNGDVGPNHYVQAVNVAMAIFDKEGNTLVEPFAINKLWEGFGGLCETNNNGDPIILYDSMADRWLISQFALSTGDNHECIAISTTGDPTGEYYLYDFPYGELMNDYPHLGVWPDGYYMGVNQFNNGAWAGGGVAAYEREKMLVGAPAKQVIISMTGSNPEVFTPMPLDIDGPMLPSPDQNQLFVWADGDGASKLHVWEFDVDWNDTSNTTFTAKTALDVDAWNSPGNAIQPNGVQLDGMPIRSMFRAAYRNLGNRSAITFTHNVGGANGTTPALRWYELDLNESTGDVTVRQQGTYAPDDQARWMGSGAMDAQGNMAFGYSLSSATQHPSVYAATRLVSDPLGTLGEEISLKEGGGSQQSINRFRWGDYSSMSVDPADDCTFWFTTEYYKAENDNTLAWSTNISSFKIPTCTAGPSGEIKGKIVDSATGEAIAKAKVSAGNASTYTDDSGNYSMTLPVGDYTLEVARYGWTTGASSEMTLSEDEVETFDLALVEAERVDVAGTIKDGDAGAWPLYAKVSVSVPGDTLVTYTNPETGEYSLPLVSGTAVKIKAEAMGTDGYLPLERDVMPSAANSMSEAFNLAVNPNCTAPGYALDEPGMTEQFEGTFPPAGWTLMTGDGTSTNWTNSDGFTRGNITGTTGLTALVNSDAAGSVNVDASLVSPLMKVSEVASTGLSFVANHRTYSGSDKLELEIQVDGGAWQSVQRMDSGRAVDDAVRKYEVELGSYLTGATDFKLRWRYFDANYEWYAALDDVLIGTPKCSVQPGNMIAGYVKDANLDTPLKGARLEADGESIALSVETVMDDGLADGFIRGFIPASAEKVTLKANGFSDKEVNAGHFTLATPIMLEAGRLESVDGAVELEVTQGRQMDSEFVLRNIGTAGADYKLLSLPFASEPMQYGPFHSSGRHLGPKSLEDLDTHAIRYFADIQAPALAAPSFVKQFALEQGFGWGLVRNRATENFWVGDLKAGGAAADILVEYDKMGKKTGSTIATDYISNFGADLAYNGRTGMLWQVNVGGENCIYEVDPSKMAATGNKICPTYGTSQRGLAYDPVSDTFYSGSWNDSVIHQFKTDGELIRSVNVSLNVAGLAFNPATGSLFVTHNEKDVKAGIFDIYVLDTTQSDMPLKGGFNVALDSDDDGKSDVDLQGQAGLDIDCDGNLWAVDQTQQIVLGFSSGESGVCSWADVPWLEMGSESGSLDVNADAKIALAAKASDIAIGDHAATIVVTNSTPYGVVNVPVTLKVNAPNYGRLGFDGTEAVVKNGDTVELSVARTEGSDFEVKAHYQVINGTAKNGKHFVLDAGILTWADKDTENKTISIPTMDLDIDQEMFFSVIINEATNASVADANSAAVTVMPDVLGKVEMAQSTMTVKEEAGSVTINVNRVDGSDRAIAVDYAVKAGSATDADVAIATGKLEWADGDTAAKTINVAITDDGDEEGEESFTVSLTAVTPDLELGQSMTTVTIQDNDNDSGSLGFVALFGLALVALRRRFAS